MPSSSGTPLAALDAVSSDAPAQYVSDHDELVAVMTRCMGFEPDGKIVRDISDILEAQRGKTLREYLDDLIVPPNPSTKARIDRATRARELFYRTEDNQVMVAAWNVKGDSFVTEKPRIWSERRLANLGQVKNYDVAHDGKRIVAIMMAEGPGEQRAQSHVIFLQNFFDELRRRVPVRK
jgi:hypothetical protein